MDTDLTSTLDTPPATTPYATCEQCHALVDESQRYCVVCGTRRRSADDPAARFMSAATGLARQAARRQAPPAPGAPLGGRGVGLGVALAVALIPAGVGLGVVVGRSDNDASRQYAALIAAVRAQKQEVINVGGGGSSTASAGGGRGSGASSRGGSKRNATRSASQKTTTPAGNAPAGPSATSYKATSRSLAAGAQVASKVAKSSGKSYVGSQSGLPSVVSIP